MLLWIFRFLISFFLLRTILLSSTEFLFLTIFPFLMLIEKLIENKTFFTLLLYLSQFLTPFRVFLTDLLTPFSHCILIRIAYFLSDNWLFDENLVFWYGVHITFYKIHFLMKLLIPFNNSIFFRIVLDLTENLLLTV